MLEHMDSLMYLQSGGIRIRSLVCYLGNVLFLFCLIQGMQEMHLNMDLVAAWRAKGQTSKVAVKIFDFALEPGWSPPPPAP